jgi:hypothetical protein
MTPYVRLDGDPSAPPPYSFPNVVVRSFMLDADWQKLQDLCDQALNLVAFEQCGFEYTAMCPFVFAAVLSYPRMLDQSTQFIGHGFDSQNETLLGFPVAKWIQMFPGIPGFESIRMLEEISIYMPYIFVDSVWSMIAGRDVIGLPKLIGSYVPSPATVPNGNFQVTVSTSVLSTFLPATQLSVKPFLSIQPASSAPGATPPGNVPWPWSFFSLSNMGGNILDPEVQALLGNNSPLSFGGFSTVQLRQLLDPETGTDASYQAILRAEFQVSNVRPASPLPQMAISFPAYASLSIAEQLGLPVDNTNTLQPVLQTQTQIDMGYGNLSTLLLTT